MSYSWNTFDDAIRHFLQTTQPKRVLDIGAGQGKYGKMIKELDIPCSRAGVREVIAVECDTRLRESLLTECGYDEVWQITAQELLDRPAEYYDMVVMGDVIEHMKHSDGRDLLEFLIYRTAYIVIVTPECMAMSSSVFYESHNSLWRPDSFAWHDLWAHQQCGIMHFYVLRGYGGSDKIHLKYAVELLNNSGSCALHSSGKLVPFQLKVHDTVFCEPYDEGNVIRYRPR